VTKKAKETKENLANLALYRKYRPQQFSEVLGQEHIVKTLEGVLKSGNVSHAYLFAGSRGTGKTTIARILAHEIGTSENDLYEIDAASNRGIDDVRELREAVFTLPFESKYKVYIVDEVHMLTKEAFNALLKTLEEPPEHVIFILATTEIEKLPDTVVSRCQTFTFKKPTRQTVASTAIAIAKREGRTLDTSGADLIALLSDGSFRDMHGFIQLVLPLCPKNITREDVAHVTGTPSNTLVISILESIAEKNAEVGLIAIQKAVEHNADMKVFLKLILEKLRVVLLMRFAPVLTSEFKEQYGEEEYSELEHFAKEKQFITTESLKEFLDAHISLNRAYLPHLPIELALMRLTDQNDDKNE
jgi:DNA polymerase III subunit gamma/tau